METDTGTTPADDTGQGTGVQSTGPAAEPDAKQEGTILSGAQEPAGGESAGGTILGEAGKSGAENGGDAGEKQDPENGEPQGAPEKYEDFTIPEGFTVEEEVMTEAKELFRGMNLSQKDAQRLVDQYSRLQQRTADRMAENEAKQIQAWKAQIQAAPGYAENRAYAGKAMARFVTEPQEKKMFEAWLGDNPVIFGLMAKIGRSLGEDGPLSKGAPQQGGYDVSKRYPVRL